MPQGLGGAHAGRISLLAEKGGERLADELLVLRQCEVHPSNPFPTALRFLDALRVREYASTFTKVKTALFTLCRMHGDVISLEWGFRGRRQHRVRPVLGHLLR